MRLILIALFAAICLQWATMAHAQQSQDHHFLSWLRTLRQDAIQFGISPHLVEEALSDAETPDPRVIRLDKKQPEGTITYEKYKKNVLTEKRVADGRALMHEHKALLHKVSEAYQVEPQYIVALWGIETSFGRNTGGYEVVNALMTLAYDGRRSEFFRKELLKALRIVDQKHIPLHEMKGSWAGAMGQCQFMPTSFERFAQDFNGDGKRDIWNTKADVFASAANYLHSEGWQKGKPLMRLVTLPKDFDNKLMGIKIQKTIKDWDELGVHLANGKKLPHDSCGVTSIVQPGGEGYKAYIVYHNYRILMKWNSSTFFATTVAQFAERLK